MLNAGVARFRQTQLAHMAIKKENLTLFDNRCQSFANALLFNHSTNFGVEDVHEAKINLAG